MVNSFGSQCALGSFMWGYGETMGGHAAAAVVARLNRGQGIS
jgi:hypothetical protein